MFTTQEKVQSPRDQRSTKLTGPQQELNETALSFKPSSHFHRALGNVALQLSSVTKGPVIQRTCSCGGGCASCSDKKQDRWNIQPKLTVGPAHDAYEQEADRVADSVMRMPRTPREQNQNPSHVHIQRHVASSAQTDPSFAAVTLPASNGQPISESTRQYMEPRFGTDFSQVRVHTNQTAQNTASQIQAKAFTHGPNIWLGKGAQESDKRLMAHELTHVVQQGAAVPWTDTQSKGNRAEGPSDIQREPQNQCPDGVKRITVDLISLRGSNRNPGDDLDFANTVFRPCCVQFDHGIGVTVDPTDSDTWLGGDTVLDRFTACGTISPEEQDMYDGARAGYGISARIQAYYVESLNPGARAASKPPYCATGPAAPYVDTTRITNSGQRRTLAHEFGHILLNSGSHTGIDNPADTSNLMVPTNSATGETLDASQCATIYSNA